MQDKIHGVKMDKSVVEHNEYQKIKKRMQIKKIISALFFVMVFIGTPFLTMKYFEIKGYTFKEDVGIITQHRYNRLDLISSGDVAFENEIHIYADYVHINQTGYNTIRSQSELFKVGMMSGFYSQLVNFYSFEFLYGQPFANHNEIVVSESISVALFNKVNSVDESVIIDDVEYIVTGVVTEPEDSMAYIYFSEINIETTSIPFYKYIVFQDRDLHLKLYERGGVDLVFGTTTLNNQSTLDFTSSMITNLLLLIVIILTYMSNSDDKNKLKEIKRNINQSYIKFMIGSYITITSILIFFLVVFIGVLAIKTSFIVALIIVTTQIARYYWVSAIYLVPIVAIVVKRISRGSNLTVK